jgi:hypothetical protein
MRRRRWTCLVTSAVATGILVLAPGQALASQGLSQLGGWWRFDEGTGAMIADSSGNGNDGMLAGSPAPSWTAGKFGDALDFTGGGWVQVPQNATLESQTISAEAWVKATSPGIYKYILAKGSNQDYASSYGLYTASTGGIGFYIADCSQYIVAAAASGPWDGTWHRVTGTYDPAVDRLRPH